MRISDWSSDVCSSDLLGVAHFPIHATRCGKRLKPRPQHRDVRMGINHLIQDAHEEKVRLDIIELMRITNVAAVAGQKTSHVGDKRSEEHTSELQSLMRISYAVFCLKKTK